MKKENQDGNWLTQVHVENALHVVSVSHECDRVIVSYVGQHSDVLPKYKEILLKNFSLITLQRALDSKHQEQIFQQTITKVWCECEMIGAYVQHL